MKKSEAIKLLNLSENASDVEIQKKFRKFVARNHPDHFSGKMEKEAANEKIVQAVEARDLLLGRVKNPMKNRRLGRSEKEKQAEANRWIFETKEYIIARMKEEEKAKRAARRRKVKAFIVLGIIVSLITVFFVGSTDVKSVFVWGVLGLMFVDGVRGLIRLRREAMNENTK